MSRVECFCLWGRPPGMVEEADCGLMSRVIGPCGREILDCADGGTRKPVMLRATCYTCTMYFEWRLDWTEGGGTMQRAFPFRGVSCCTKPSPRARTHPHRTIRDGAVWTMGSRTSRSDTRGGERTHETNSKKFFAERKLPRTCPRRCPPRAVCVEGPVPLCGLLSVSRLHALHRPSTVALDHEDGVLKVLRACRANHV